MTAAGLFFALTLCGAPCINDALRRPPPRLACEQVCARAIQSCTAGRAAAYNQCRRAWVYYCRAFGPGVCV